MVTDSERDYLWQTYAADRRARINLGIRRRLAPLLERDRRRIELMNSLLLSMPGTPVIYYGDEIGMGDNIHLGDRNGVRTPMQWSPDRNGGFSRADPAALVLPTIMDPLYGYAVVNVEAQSRDPHSLLNWTRRMLAVRRRHPAFGRGTITLSVSEEPQDSRVSSRVRRETILCVANRRAQLAGGRTRPVAIQRPRPGRTQRRNAVPADRRAHLSADPAALRLLLVRAGEGERLAGLAYAGAGADGGIRDHRPSRSSRQRRNVDRQKNDRERRPAAICRQTPLVRIERRNHQIGAHRQCAQDRRSRPRHSLERNRDKDKRRQYDKMAASAVDLVGERSVGGAAAAPGAWRACARAVISDF